MGLVGNDATARTSGLCTRSDVFPPLPTTAATIAAFEPNGASVHRCLLSNLSANSEQLVRLRRIGFQL